MSQTPVRPAAAEHAERAQQAGRASVARWLTPVNAVILAATLLALGLRVYQLTRPGHLLGVGDYDDGADFGSALRLVHGVLPYRDFVLVQPPGSTLLMAPAAALSYLMPAAPALAVGRILTILASTACVLAGGLIARRHGLLATIVTCGLLAIYPGSVMAAHTVLLEPWLVLFCLVGTAVVFDGDRLTASWRHLAWGGAAFGFAGAIKAWAILPVLVVLALCLPRPRARAVAFALGVVGGFVLPVLPFVALAPRAFYDSVVVAQLARTGARTPLDFRLRQMTGLNVAHLPSGTLLLAALVAAALVAGCQLAAVIVTRTPPSPLEWFALVTTALVVVSFLLPDDFYYHYAAFLAPFLALAVALPLARLLPDPAPGGGPHGRTRLAAQRGLAAVTAAVVIVALPLLAPGAEDSHSPAFAGATAVDRVIPSGACVLSDQVSLLIAVDRFFSATAGCSREIDGTGVSYALGHGRAAADAGAFPAVATVWSGAFHAAQYVLLTAWNANRIAWTPGLRTYFLANFRLVHGSWPAQLSLYVRRGAASTGTR